MPAPDWLTARPIAHRGLHDPARGIVENTASAVEAAIVGGYGIEVDLQVSADGEAMVHHDRVLGRLTDGRGELAALTAAELKRVAFRSTGERMMTLGELCDLVQARAALVLELKSGPGNDRLVARTAAVLKSYAGPAAAMSFDPRLVAALKAAAPRLPRGIVSERRFDHREWDFLSAMRKRAAANLLHVFGCSAHFVAYCIDDLPAPAPLVARYLFGLALLTWTVRTEDQRRRAAQYADQMIFEGFRP